MIQSKVATRAFLVNRGLINENEGYCIFCNENEESVNHLFVHCKYSWKVWCFCLEWWGLVWVCPSSMSQVMEWWFLSRKKDVKDGLWLALFYAVTWSIWMARNESLFRGRIFHWVEITEIAIYRASLWVKSKFEDIPYSIGEFKRNIDVVRRCKGADSCRRDRGVVVWAPPIHGSMKFNVDGSSLGKPGATAIGGVLRNEGGVLNVFFQNQLVWLIRMWQNLWQSVKL